MTRALPVLVALSALGAAAAALLHLAPPLVGWFSALTAFGFTLACAFAARALDAPANLREPRVPCGPTVDDDSIALPRGGALGRLWAFAAAAVALAGLVPFAALARRPARRGTAWSGGIRLVTPDGTPLRPDDLEVGGVATVFPAGHVDAPESATMLVRVGDGVLRTRPGREGWAPQGNVAYSKICTHAGCPVAIYRHASYQLYCPCHQSTFDVLDAATPIAGPATRALPQLALDVDAAGYLIARGDFDKPVGPGDWWTPT